MRSIFESLNHGDCISWKCLTNKTVLYFSYAYSRTTWAIGIVHHDRKFTKPAFEWRKTEYSMWLALKIIFAVWNEERVEIWRGHIWLPEVNHILIDYLLIYSVSAVSLPYEPYRFINCSLTAHNFETFIANSKVH